MFGDLWLVKQLHSEASVVQLGVRRANTLPRQVTGILPLDFTKIGEIAIG
jgi:hypothetical protein